MKFRKKPLLVDAVQVTKENIILLSKRLKLDLSLMDDNEMVIPEPVAVMVKTIDGNSAYVGIGDWIIRGIRGELYPCRGDIFDDSYDAITVTAVLDVARIPEVSIGALRRGMRIEATNVLRAEDARDSNGHALAVSFFAEACTPKNVLRILDRLYELEESK